MNYTTQGEPTDNLGYFPVALQSAAWVQDLVKLDSPDRL